MIRAVLLQKIDILSLLFILAKRFLRFIADVIQLLVIAGRLDIHHPFLQVGDQKLLINDHAEQHGHDKVEIFTLSPLYFPFPLFHGNPISSSYH